MKLKAVETFIHVWAGSKSNSHFSAPLSLTLGLFSFGLLLLDYTSEFAEIDMQSSEQLCPKVSNKLDTSIFLFYFFLISILMRSISPRICAVTKTDIVTSNALDA